MKIRDGYHKIRLYHDTYIMPYGQNAADRKPSLKLNATSEFLWDALVGGADETALVDLAAREFEATEADLPILREDIRHFISTLAAYGIVELSQSQERSQRHDPFYYRIGSLTFAYYGPSQLTDQYFKTFACPAVPHVDQQIQLRTGRPLHRDNGTIVLRTDELILCDAGSKYRFLFPSDWGIHEMTVEKDGSTVIAYCEPEAFDKDHLEHVFHALRFAFLLLAQKHHLYVLHSASFLYREKAWLFSGSSGTGKSTHTNLWHELYDVTLLNGDLNVIGIQDGVPMVYGLPWCGTSGICTPDTHPLGGIVFLMRSEENHVHIPSESEQAFLLTQRLISPIWDCSMLQQQTAFCASIAACTPIMLLECTKEKEAAETMKQAIDQL